MNYFESFLSMVLIGDQNGLARIINIGFADKIYKHDEAQHGIIKAELVPKNGHQRLRPIHLACDRGHFHVVEMLIAHACDINAPSRIGNRPIHIAASRGHWEVVALLIRNKCLVNVKDERYCTALHLAVKGDHKKVTKVLLCSGVDPLKTDSTNMTAYDLALSHGNESVATTILDWHTLKKTLSNIQDGRFKDILSHSGFKKFYINNDFSITALTDYIKDVDRYKLLEHMISELRFFHYIRRHQNDEWLLQADIEAINQIFDQDNSLKYCLKHEECCPFFCINLMTLILEMNKMEDNLQRMHNIAEHLPNRNIVKIVRKRQDFVHVKKKAFWNRLHLAVSDDRCDMVEYLLIKNLVSVNSTDEAGNSPLFLACIHGRQDCAMLLLRHGADVNTKNKYGQSLLQIAIENGMEDVIMRNFNLVKIFESTDCLGHTALDMAIKSGSDRLCEELLSKFKCVDHEITNSTALAYHSCQGDQDIPNAISSKENLASISLKVRGYILPSLIFRMSDESLQILDENNSTLLHLAAWNLSCETCRCLIERGADVNSTNDEGSTPMHEVINRYLYDNADYKEESLLATVQVLINAGASIDVQNKQRETSLKLALQFVNEKLIREMTSKSTLIVLDRIDLEFLLNGKYFDLIKEFIPKTHEKSFESLITESFMIKCLEDLDLPSILVVIDMASSKVRDSVLYKLLTSKSINMNRVALLHCLMTYCSDPSSIIEGETILTYFLKSGQTFFCEEILSSEYAYSFSLWSNVSNQSPLHVAAERGFFRLLKLALPHSDECDSKDDNSDTPLGLLLKHWSKSTNVSIPLLKEQLSLVSELAMVFILKGSEINHENLNGEKVIDLCCDVSLKRKLILAYGRYQTKVRRLQNQHCYTQSSNQSSSTLTSLNSMF